MEGEYPVTCICSALGVSRSSWYHQNKRKAKVITREELKVHRRIKELFNTSRGSLGSRQLVKRLAVEGITISRTKVRGIMTVHKLLTLRTPSLKQTYYLIPA